MNFFSRALKRGLTLPNILSWLCLATGNLWGSFWGTLGFKMKAALLGVKFGPNLRVHGRAAILRWPGGVITIGANVSIISSWRRATACALAFPARFRVFGPGAVIEIGDNAELSGTSITARSKKISIGNNVLIGPNCVIVDSDFHAHWPPETRATDPGYENDKPVTIGDYAWIGMGSIILKGVQIGKGSIIGAGSVVAENIPENCVACGNPARVIKYMDKTTHEKR